MKFFRKMDEMELHLSLNAIRVAWFFTVMALFVWGIWGMSRPAASPRPCTCSSFRICCTSWLLQVGKWRTGDRDGAKSLLLYVLLLVIFLLAFGLLLWRVGL